MLSGPPRSSISALLCDDQTRRGTLKGCRLRKFSCKIFRISTGTFGITFRVHGTTGKSQFTLLVSQPLLRYIIIHTAVISFTKSLITVSCWPKASRTRIHPPIQTKVQTRLPGSASNFCYTAIYDRSFCLQPMT